LIPASCKKLNKRQKIKSSHLELFQSKSSSSSNPEVVLLGRRMDGRSQKVQRSGENSCCLDLASNSSSVFASGLVKPCSDCNFLPILAEMGVGDGVIVLRHFPAIKYYYCKFTPVTKSSRFNNIEDVV
jgi:hypothetical protein